MSYYTRRTRMILRSLIYLSLLTFIGILFYQNRALVKLNIAKDERIELQSKLFSGRELTYLAKIKRLEGKIDTLQGTNTLNKEQISFQAETIFNLLKTQPQVR